MFLLGTAVTFVLFVTGTVGIHWLRKRIDRGTTKGSVRYVLPLAMIWGLGGYWIIARGLALPLDSPALLCGLLLAAGIVPLAYFVDDLAAADAADAFVALVVALVLGFVLLELHSRRILIEAVDARGADPGDYIQRADRLKRASALSADRPVPDGVRFHRSTDHEPSRGGTNHPAESRRGKPPDQQQVHDSADEEHEHQHPAAADAQDAVLGSHQKRTEPSGAPMGQQDLQRTPSAR